jgi:hypothetical protein
MMGSVTETPYLRVVRGEPTAEEVAALAAVLAAVLAARSAAPAPGPRLRPAWSDPARRLGLTARPGPAAWLRSSLPA